MHWYQMKIKEALAKLATTDEGLTEEEAAQRLEKYGPNKLAEEERISRLKILLHQFTSPLIYILLIAVVVTLLLGEYIDTGVIVAVVLLNAVVGYFHEFKAEESVRSLKRLLVAKARVIRSGHEKEIPGADLVPGGSRDRGAPGGGYWDSVYLFTNSYVSKQINTVPMSPLHLRAAPAVGIPHGGP